MTIWSRFTSWLSRWPESKDRKSEKEYAYLFEEEEKLKKNPKKPKGLKPKKKKSRGKK